MCLSFHCNLSFVIRSLKRVKIEKQLYKLFALVSVINKYQASHHTIDLMTSKHSVYIYKITLYVETYLQIPSC